MPRTAPSIITTAVRESLNGKNRLKPRLKYNFTCVYYHNSDGTERFLNLEREKQVDGLLGHYKHSFFWSIQTESLLHTLGVLLDQGTRGQSIIYRHQKINVEEKTSAGLRLLGSAELQ